MSAVVVVGGAFVAGSFVRSPWQDAVENAEGSASTTAQVVSREFSARTAPVAGAVSLGATMTVAVPEVATPRTVVTSATPAKGSRVSSGRVLAGVSGRPLIALDLQLPLYRDLTPGTTGPDVRSLQQALVDLGLLHGAVDGEYGPATSGAVTALYTRSGYDPPAAVRYAGAETADEVLPPADAGAGAETDETDETDATEDVAGTARARPARAEAQGTVRTGTPLPWAEVVDVPAEGATVRTASKAGRVLEPGSPLLTLRTGSAHVTARVPAADKAHYRRGTKVLVDLPGTETRRFEASITSRSRFRPGDGDGALPGYDIRVPLPAAALDGVRDGTSATVGPAAAEAAVTAPAVPLAAVRQDDGGTYVLTPAASGDVPRRVDVTLGLQQDGYLQVDAGEVTVGQTLVVGGDAEAPTRGSDG
ncbi:peptidoglycan-binding protein [Isoptericola sp. NPDC057191]|uniref:peptidoglycan-binding protein n=1 Tax=Isoptericola sp. NPDC057191 TaxID=3346041 RepID=UPI003633171F